MGFTSGKADPILGITNTQLLTRVVVLEKWKASNPVGPPGPMGPMGPQGPAGPAGASAAELAALKARMDAIEQKVCPQESRIKNLELDHIPDA